RGSNPQPLPYRGSALPVAPRRPDCSFAGLQTNCYEPVVPDGDDRPDLVLGDGAVLDRVTEGINDVPGSTGSPDRPPAPCPAGERGERGSACEGGGGDEEIGGDALNHPRSPSGPGR